MHENDWPAYVLELNKRRAALRKGAPDAMAGFSALAQAASAEGTLSPKFKELIAVAISVAVRCDGCIAYHTRAAVRLGASREEVLETLGMSVYMGGGPSMIYAGEALDAFDAYAAQAQAD